MSFFSFLRLLGVRRQRNARPARARKPRRRTQAPSVEALESRLTPATPPTILSVRLHSVIARSASPKVAVLKITGCLGEAKLVKPIVHIVVPIKELHHRGIGVCSR